MSSAVSLLTGIRLSAKLFPFLKTKQGFHFFFTCSFPSTTTPPSCFLLFPLMRLSWTVPSLKFRLKNCKKAVASRWIWPYPWPRGQPRSPARPLWQPRDHRRRWSGELSCPTKIKHANVNVCHNRVATLLLLIFHNDMLRCACLNFRQHAWINTDGRVAKNNTSNDTVVNNKQLLQKKTPQ